MADERFAAVGYEIIQSVEIGGTKIVIAENPAAEKPYMTWRRSVDESFGAEKHLLPMFSDDYLDILREFVRCQSACVDNLSLDRVYRGSALEDAPLSHRDCVPDGMDADLKGKVVAIKADSLLPEYRARSHQLLLAVGGFGCSPGARGSAVFGTVIYSGEQERWNRGDILGVVDEAALPAWAHEKLSKLREARGKESVIAKIREAKTNPDPPKEEPQPQKHRNNGPEH